MTADEKQKLYDAIGYEENVTSDLPKEVCYLLCSSCTTVYNQISIYWTELTWSLVYIEQTSKSGS